MIQIEDRNQIKEYYSRFPMNDYFGTDIQPFTRIVQFEPDDVILREGEEPEYLYYLIEGRAKLFLTHENGRISLVNFLSAPCFIGEMELLEAQKYANGVKAITICTCFAIQTRLCKTQLLQDTRFLQHICVFLGKKAISNTDNYSRNQSYPLDVRLAAFILTTANNGYYRERHTEAAEYLGVTYRHLLYVLADFVKKGLVKKTPQGYHIENQAVLREIAERD